MTSANQVRARDGAWTARGLKLRRVWCVISDAAALSGAWGHVRSPMAVRLPLMCRSAQDDLSGTFKNEIEAIFVAVMQRAVVFAI